jgi:hypothetical protein
MAVGLKVLRRDAKSLLGDIHDALRFCGLGDFNIGLRILVLGGGHEDDPLLREIFVGNVWFVMPGHSRSKNGVASLAYVPGNHVFLLGQARRGWPGQARP